MTALVELYLAENQIKSLAGLKDLPALKKLHLRKNEIAEVDSVPVLPSLEYLNLRENQIAKLADIVQLGSNKGLNVLIVTGNPVGEELGDGLKKEILIAMDHLAFKRINKDEITPEEVQEAAAEKE